MKLLIVVFLLTSISCYGQQVKVVMPNGDTSVYVPQKTRTVFRQKTVHDSLWLIVHDTARTDTVQREYFQREIEPVFMSVKVETLHDTVTIQPKEKPSLLPFFAAGLYGLAHTDAEPFGGIGIQVQQGHFGISAMARMQYYFGQPADPSIGITLPLKAQWQSSFEGAVTIYLY